MKDALKFVGGSVAVYVVMAACSSRSPTPEIGSYAPPAVGGGASGGMPSGGGQPASGGMVAQAGETTGGAQMGAAGQTEGAGGSGGSAPLDAGVMDAMMDPVPDAAAQEMSGSRLKARYYVGDDGSKQFVGWYDSQRKENCGFMMAGDGVLRCLPTITASSGSYFSDSGCTSPLFAALTAQCGTSGATYGYSLDGCNYNVFQMTKVTPSSVYIGSATTCTALASTSTTSLTFFTGAEVAAASFVKGTEQVE